MKLYVGRIELFGLDLLLTVHEDGTHEVATRREAWETWGPPTTLIPQSAEIDEAVT